MLPLPALDDGSRSSHRALLFSQLCLWPLFQEALQDHPGGNLATRPSEINEWISRTLHHLNPASWLLTQSPPNCQKRPPPAQNRSHEHAVREGWPWPLPQSLDLPAFPPPRGPGHPGPAPREDLKDELRGGDGSTGSVVHGQERRAGRAEAQNTGCRHTPCTAEDQHGIPSPRGGEHRAVPGAERGVAPRKGFPLEEPHYSWWGLGIRIAPSAFWLKEWVFLRVEGGDWTLTACQAPARYLVYSAQCPEIRLQVRQSCLRTAMWSSDSTSRQTPKQGKQVCAAVFAHPCP